jgi:hypothetical protein
LTHFTIGTSLNISVLIATPTYQSSYLLLYMCPQSHKFLRILLWRLLSQHQLPGLCITHARRYRERHRCVCACLRVCVCVCVCVCACVCVCKCVLTFCVSLSGCFVSLGYLFLRGTKYIFLSSSCYISSSYLSSQRVLMPLHMRRETTLLSTCFTVMILCI